MEVKFITVTSNGYKVELNPTEIHPTTVVLTDVVRNPYFLLGDGRYAVATKFKVSPSSIIVEDYVPVVGEVPAFYENTLIKVLERHRLVEEKVQEEVNEVSHMTADKAYRMYLQNPNVMIPYKLIKEIDEEIKQRANDGYCNLRFELYGHESTHDERKTAVYHYSRNGFKVVKCMDLSFITLGW
jgi:hypothetical protein